MLTNLRILVIAACTGVLLAQNADDWVPLAFGSGGLLVLTLFALASGRK